MSLARSDLLQQINAGNLGTGSFTTSAFTPPASSYMLVAVFATENSGSAPNVNDVTLSSSTGLTFSKPVTPLAAGASFATYALIFAAPVTSSVSTTLTIGFTGRTISVVGVSVAAWTGYNTSTPIGTVGNALNGAIGGPPTPFSFTLPAPPASTSEVWAFVGADKTTADITPGAGWTETADQFNGASVNGGFETQVRASSTSTTVAWADLRPGGGALFNWAALAVEVQAQTEADLAATFTGTGGMTVALTNQVPLAAGMTGTGGMAVAFAPSTTTLGAGLTATAGMSVAFTVTGATGPADPIASPVAAQLLACFTQQLNTLPKPPQSIQLRVGSETGPLIGPNVDECCSGLAWIRVTAVYPSWDNFPAEDNTWLPTGPLAYAVVLEMGVAFCMPWSDSEDSFDNMDPPSSDDWAAAFATQMQHQTLMRRAAACCFRPTQRRAVGEWVSLPVEGGCTGGKMTVIVSVIAPCADC